jgi:hypothetical protein
MNCRFCDRKDIFKFLELGTMALANSFLTREELLSIKEPKYPSMFFCEQCGLVQIGYVVPPARSSRITSTFPHLRPRP